jgi:hypothetical protein
MDVDPWPAIRLPQLPGSTVTFDFIAVSRSNCFAKMPVPRDRLLRQIVERLAIKE